MGRPGTKTVITKFPQPTTTVPLVHPVPTIPTVGLPPVQPQTTPLPGALSTLPPALPAKPEGYYPPASEEPITFPDDITIDELIEHRRIVGAKSPIYWAAFDEIQRKRDIMYEIHLNSQLKAFQDLTIALYTVNKLKVPETVGKPFQAD